MIDDNENISYFFAPYTIKFDKDGGGRGYCHKFEFICHNLRVCKAWEKAPVMMENDDEND